MSGITPEEYDQILEENDWSPAVRGEFERLRRSAQDRRELLARLSERELHERRVHQWQIESTRELRKVFAESFEVSAWLRREQKPALAVEDGTDSDRSFEGCESASVGREVKRRPDAYCKRGGSPTMPS